MQSQQRNLKRKIFNAKNAEERGASQNLAEAAETPEDSIERNWGSPFTSKHRTIHEERRSPACDSHSPRVSLPEETEEWDSMAEKARVHKGELPLGFPLFRAISGEGGRHRLAPSFQSEAICLCGRAFPGVGRSHVTRPRTGIYLQAFW